MRRLSLLLVLLLALTGCALPSIPGVPGLSGGGGGGSTSEPLWSDVPPLPGSTKLDIDLPLPVKLLVRGFVAAAQSPEENNGEESKDWDFKVYQAAGSGTDLGTFYSQDQMAASGWSPGDPPCGASSPIPTGGSLCLFTKSGNDGFTDNLAIVLLPGEADNGADQVAYVRFASKG